jgi:uncharacterized oligopeptide transporter (OPT) family protein
LFLKDGPEKLTSAQFPMPSATVWRAVADMLTKGLSEIRPSSQAIAVGGAALGILLEVIRIATRGRFWLSGVGIGLAAVIPFPTCLAMFLGASTFWVIERIWRNPDSTVHRLVVQNQEPICGGLIAGGALMGIVVLLLENFALE